MLIILLMFAFIRTLRGVPLASPSEPPSPLPALDLRDTQSHFGQRTVNEIVISCLATIFACTWSAVHPNIPAVTDSKWTCFKRRVTITIYALLAPELMTMWAMRQRLAAKEIMDEYNKVINGFTADSDRETLSERFKGGLQAILGTVYGVFQECPLPPLLKEGEGPQWTLAHGFFLQMGGFMLCESGRPVQTLIDGSRKENNEETRLLWNIQQKVIDPPRITEEDIQDRSKGDDISKTFIVLQTTWFVVQCIARWSQRLPVTELEVVTLGFAMLNGITYGLWWDKPQNVGRPVFLESKKPRGDTSESVVEPSTAGNTTSEDAESESNPLLPQAEPGKESWLRRHIRQDIMEEFGGSRGALLVLLPMLIFVAFLRPLGKLLGVNDTDTVTKTPPMRVAMFYAEDSYAGDSEDEAEYATYAIAALFGSVHLIPSWSLHFASHQEMWIWRVSAIIMTAAPVFMGLSSYFYETSTSLEDVFDAFMGVGAIFYPFARIIILILSLTALRSLPHGALQTIEWTTFIPHL
ncbi:hypothetical protein BJ912DRAFT_408550 [Pholiota molesta]|nr:hypothetical protein BJ912DRAFT_408550 [Pholiota molesta]